MSVGKMVLLTGAGGFLGRHLGPALLDAGFRVVAVSSKGRDELVSLWEEASGSVDGVATGKVEVIGLNDRDALQDGLACTDILLSCGFPRGGDGFEMACGLEFISWLFRCAADAGAGAVVNVSSQSVYDQHRDRPASESDPICPMGDYAVAKYATELMLEASCTSIPHTSVRLASLIGPGFDQRVTNKMVKQALSGERLFVEENGSRFGYLDVQDAVSGLVTLVETNTCEWRKAMNLGPFAGATLTQIAAAAVSAATRCGVHSLRPSMKTTASKPIDSRLSMELFTAATGWTPSISLEGSIERITAYERARR